MRGVWPLTALLGAALLGGWWAQAQTTPDQSTSGREAPAHTALAQSGAAPSAAAQSSAGDRAAQNRFTPKPLTSQERSGLAALFTKLRPATLRIEQCPVNDCSDPDGIGTAFLISEDGLALTAYHVIFRAEALSARTVDRKLHKVQVIGYDDQYDLALLKVDVPKGTPYLPLAKGAPKIGDAALAIGNGDGAFLRSKTGRFTGLNSEAGRADFPPGTLELNAPLIPGDSGGPIINLAGEVTGVVSYIRWGREDEEAELQISAYAVPVSAADPRVAELRRGVKRDAPVIGISLRGQLGLLSNLPRDLFSDASEGLGLDLGSTPGAFFNAVSPGSPAAKAGLQPLRYDQAGKRVAGDIVTAVNGKRIFNFSDFQFAVRQHSPGDTVSLSVLRAGKPLTLSLKLTSRATVSNN